MGPISLEETIRNDFKIEGTHLMKFGIRVTERFPITEYPVRCCIGGEPNLASPGQISLIKCRKAAPCIEYDSLDRADGRRVQISLDW